MPQITSTEIAENPLYRDLDFSGVSVNYSPSFLQDQIVRDLNYAKAHSGFLPVDGFTNYLRWHWLTDEEQTGNDARFATYHGPKITKAIEVDFGKRTEFPNLSQVITPPVTGSPQPPPSGSTTCPPQPGGNPTHPGSVPEPGTGIMLTLGMVLAFVVRRAVAGYRFA